MFIKKKYGGWIALPVAAIVLLSAGTVSAHGWFGFGPSATPDEIAQRQSIMFQEQATLLGLSVDDVKNAWAKGQTLHELATEKGITQAQLQEKMKAASKTRMQAELKALVDKGVITQAQADQRLSVMQKQLESGKGRGGKMMGMGRGMHF